MGISITGFDQLSLVLEQVTDRSVRGVQNVLEDGAYWIGQTAKEYSPVDTMNLENAIKIMKAQDGSNRRNVFYVYVDESEPASAENDDGDVYPSSAGKTVGDYALLMHEGLAPYGSGAFELGKKSQRKAAMGLDVGGKYMSRALEDHADDIYNRSEAALSRALGARNAKKGNR